MKTLVMLWASVFIVNSCVSRHPAPAFSTEKEYVFQDTLALQVYESLINNLYDGKTPEVILVADSTIVYTPLDTNDVFTKRSKQNQIPRYLIDSLAKKSAAPTLATTLQLPRNVKFLDRDASKQAQDKGLGATIVFAFSPVAFSPTGNQALVYMTIGCGGLCGSGKVYFLERNNQGQWILLYSVQSWIS